MLYFTFIVQYTVQPTKSQSSEIIILTKHKIGVLHLKEPRLNLHKWNENSSYMFPVVFYLSTVFTTESEKIRHCKILKATLKMLKI